MQPIQLPVTQVGLEQSIEAAMRKAGRTSQINFGGSSRQINAISQPLGRITGQADEFAKSMAAANARVLAFGASVGILASVSKAMQGLVSSTIEVEKNLVSINSVLGVTGAELEKFGQKIFDVARNTGQTFDVVAKGALELSRQGLSAEETLKRLNDALILSRLSGLDAEKSVEGLTAAFNSFSDTGITTEQILNKLVLVSQKFAVSEKDLVEGLKRSASVADQAGVSFDELVAIITAVQERTARGGAVIGNSFKTIFARIQDKAVLSDLQDIGVQITDLQGKILPATTILQNLSKEMDNLSQVEQADLAKKLGGVFQLSNLLAALKDLNSENSKYTQALETSQRAADEAYKKNAVLNETLASLINRVQVSAQELGATLGAIGVTDNLKNILSFFSGLLESVQQVLGEESALGGFLRGLAKGIGNLIAGPGLALFGAIILKLSKDLVQFGFSSLKSFFGIGRAAKEVKDVESSIQQILARNVDLQQKLFSLEGNRAAQLRLITDALVQQEALLRRSANTASSLAPALYGAGARGTSSGLRINPPNAAGGYMPAVAKEKQSISKGVGGAKSGDKPVVIPNFNFGGGKSGPMVAHTGEYIVPNFAGKGSAVFNRDMVRSIGLPSGAKKIGAAGGFIPNFINESIVTKEFANKSFKSFKNKEKADLFDTFGAKINIIRQNKTNAIYNKEAIDQARAILPSFGLKTGKKIDEVELDKTLEKYKKAGVDPVSIKTLETAIKNADPKKSQEKSYQWINIQNKIKGIIGEIDASKMLKSPLSQGNDFFDLTSGEEVKTKKEQNAKDLVKKFANNYLINNNIAKNKKKDKIFGKMSVLIPKDGKIKNYAEGYIPKFTGPKGNVKGTSIQIARQIIDAYLNKTNLKGRIPTAEEYNPALAFINSNLTAKQKIEAEREAKKQARKSLPTINGIEKYGLLIASLIGPSKKNLFASSDGKITQTATDSSDYQIGFPMAGVIDKEFSASYYQKQSRGGVKEALKNEEKFKGSKLKFSEAKNFITGLNAGSFGSVGGTIAENILRTRSGIGIQAQGQRIDLPLTDKLRKLTTGFPASVQSVEVKNSIKRDNLLSMGEKLFSLRNEPGMITEGKIIAKAASTSKPKIDIVSEDKLDAKLATNAPKGSPIYIDNDILKRIGAKREELVSEAQKSKNYNLVMGAPGVGKSTFVENKLGAYAATSLAQIKNAVKNNIPIYDVRASKENAAALLNTQNINKAILLTASKEQIEQNRLSRDISGAKQFGRSAGSTSGGYTNTDDLEALVTQRLGNKSEIYGLSGSDWKQKSTKELVASKLAKIAMIRGAFAPFTLGHQKLVQTSIAKGFDKDNVFVSVSRGTSSSTAYNPKNSNSNRTILFDAAFRLMMAKAGLQGIIPEDNVFVSDSRSSVAPFAIKKGDSYVVPSKGSRGFLGSDKDPKKSIQDFQLGGYDTVNFLARAEDDISGTAARAALLEGSETGNYSKLSNLVSAPVLNILKKYAPTISKRRKVLEKGGVRTLAELRGLGPEYQFGTSANGFIPNFASPNAIAAMQRLLSDPAATQGEKANARKFLAKFGAGYSFGSTASKGRPISLRQVFDQLDSEVGISQLIDAAYASAGPTASIENVFSKFQQQTLSNPQKLRDLVRKKGYIPNFADPLKEAIGREMSAGVPASQIYIDKSASLKNAMNPMGLMVANRRDEPAGGFQGVNRARREGANPMMYGAASGFVPNYANSGPGTMVSATGTSTGVSRQPSNTVSNPDPELQAASRDFLGTIFAVQAGLSVLSGFFQESESKMAKAVGGIVNALSSGTNVLFASQGIQAAVGDRFGKGVQSAIGKIGLFGAAAITAYTAFNETAKYLDSTNTSINKASQAMSRVSDAASKASVNLNTLNKAQQAAISQRGKALLSSARETTTTSTNYSASMYAPPQAFPTKGFATFEGISSDLQDQLQEVINQGLGVGIAYDDIWNKINKAAESGSKITAQEVQKISIELETLTKNIQKASPEAALQNQDLGLSFKEGIGKELVGLDSEKLSKFLSNPNTRGPTQGLQDYFFKAGVEGDVPRQELIRKTIDLLKEQQKQEESTAKESVAQSKLRLDAAIKALKIEAEARKALGALDDQANLNEISNLQTILKINSDITKSEFDRSIAIAEQASQNQRQIESLEAQRKLVQEIVDTSGKFDITLPSDKKLTASIETSRFLQEQSKNPGMLDLTKDLQSGKINEKTFKDNLEYVVKAYLPELSKIEGFTNEVANKLISILQLSISQEESQKKLKDTAERKLKVDLDTLRINENNKRVFERAQNTLGVSADERSIAARRLGGRNQIIEAETQLRLAELGQRSGQFSSSDFAKEQRKILNESFQKQLQNEIQQQKLEAEADLIRNFTIEQNIQALLDNSKATKDNTQALLGYSSETAIIGNDNINLQAEGGIYAAAKSAIKNNIFAEVNDQANNCAKVIIKFAKTIGLGIDGATNVANSFQKVGTAVDKSDIRPGDILIKKGKRGGRPQDTGGHVGMYLGNNAVLQASQGAYDADVFTPQQRVATTKYDSTYWNMVRRPSSNIVPTMIEDDLAMKSKKAVEFQIEQAKALSTLKDPSDILNKARKATNDMGTSSEATALSIKNLALRMQEIGESAAIKEAVNRIETIKSNVENRPESAASRQISDLDRSIKDAREAPSTFQEGMSIAFKQMELDSLNFASKIGQDIPKMFADGMSNAIMSAIEGTSSLKDALRSAAYEFLKSINSQLINQFANKAITSVQGFMGFASGGQVKGGSGMKDDVPAMLMGGEFVINKKSVQKYGSPFLEAINNGNIRGYAKGGTVQKGPQGNFYTPGTFGQGAIEGKRNLLDFATQTGTTGKFDRIINEEGFASIALEPESSKLSISGMRKNPAFQATQSAKQEAFNLYLQQYNQEREAKKQEEEAKKAFKKQLLFTIGSLAVSAVASSGAAGFASAAKAAAGAGAGTGGQLLAGAKGIFTGGSIGGQNTGGLFNLFSGAGKTLSGNFREGVNLMKLSRIGNADQLAQAMQADSSFADFIGSRGGTILPALSVSAPSKGRFNWKSNNGILTPEKDSFDLPVFENFPDDIYLDPGVLPIRRQATGGIIPQTSGIDTIPAMLSGGEFIMNRAAVQNIGTGNLQAMNSGSTSVLTEEKSKEFNEKLVSKLDELIDVSGAKGDITINISGSGNGSQEQTSSQDPSTSRQQLARQIKDAVLQVIEDEKRLGGQLRRR